jgi:hypothetical protein
MKTEFDCSIIASVLDAGKVLANAGNAGAVVAGIGCVMTQSPGARLAFLCVTLVWLAQCWFAVRVEVCASLFRALATDPEDGPDRQDELLADWGLIPKSRVRKRSIADRSLGGLKFFRRQRFVLRSELVILVVGIGLQIAGV